MLRKSDVLGFASITLINTYLKLSVAIFILPPVILKEIGHRL